MQHVANERVVALKGARGWSVGATTGTDIDGARLSVRRHFHGDMPGTGDGGAICRFPNPTHGFIKGDADGRMFEDADAAFAFAVERGYSRPYYPRARRST